MNFRNKIQTRVAILILMALPSLSMAMSTGAENILGKQFCSANDLPNSGWGFTKDGEAYYFAPNVGMPDPNSYYKVTFLRNPQMFQINHYRKGTNALIQTVGIFAYHHRTQSIASGQDVLSVEVCR